MDLKERSKVIKLLSLKASFATCKNMNPCFKQRNNEVLDKYTKETRNLSNYFWTSEAVTDGPTYSSSKEEKVKINVLRRTEQNKNLISDFYSNCEKSSLSRFESFGEILDISSAIKFSLFNFPNLISIYIETLPLDVCHKVRLICNFIDIWI